MRHSLLSGGLVLVLCVCAQASTELVNGDFSLGQEGGVALEWIFEGTGTPLVTDGSQIIADVPPGEVGTVYQVVPLCQAGAVYRMSVHVTAVSGSNATVLVGLGPRRNPEFEEIVWAPASAPGEVSVEVQAAESNLVAYLSLTNPLIEEESGDPASAVFESAELKVLEVPAASPPSYPEPSALDRLEAERKYAAAMDLLMLKEAPDADDIFSEIVDGLPEARPEAAMALVRMFEVDHFKQWLVRLRPDVDPAEFLGIPHLRAVLERYPEQTEACSLARRRIGEYYLDAHQLEMAKYHLERVLEDYPGTEGAAWSHLALINCHIWGHEPEKARPHYEAMQAAYERGEITDEQFAWAEHRFIAQQLARANDVQAHNDYLEDMWKRYRDTAPEVALYCKNARIDDLFAHNLIPPYQYIQEYEELITGMPDYPHLTAGFSIVLAMAYESRAWKPEHLQRAVELLTQVTTNENISSFYRNEAQYFLDMIDPNRSLPDYTADLGRNTLSEPNFEHLMHPYGQWEVFGDGPNWEKCDWFSKSQRKKHQDQRPAWNSINCGEAKRMESVLVHRRVFAAPQALFHAEISVAAEGFLGGELDQTFYDLKVAFFDPWFRPLGEFKLENVASNGVAKEWQRLVLDAETPEDAYYAEFRVRYVADGPGHHAVALADASISYEAKEGE